MALYCKVYRLNYEEDNYDMYGIRNDDCWMQKSGCEIHPLAYGT